MLADLVLAAVAINDAPFRSLAECRDAFNALWHLEVEIDELRVVREQLQLAGSLEPGASGIALTQAARDNLANRARESDETEEEALADWRASIEAARPDLTDEDFAYLREDLGTWLNQVIVRHGLEAAYLLYPEDDRAELLFKQIEGEGTHFLPARSTRILDIRDDALPRFVRDATHAQRRFLANRMNTAFYLTVLTLDPDAKALAQESVQGRRIYLDTNFLYAVLGKSTLAEINSAHRLLDLTSSLGIELAVTPWTIAEIRKSIQSARLRAEQHVTRPELAQVMAAVTGEKGYGHAFWSDFHRTGMRPQDWFDRAMHFEHDLKSLNIREVHDGCPAVDDDSERVNEYCALLERFLGPLRARHPDVVEHDVKHRLLVERLRGEGHLSFSNARFWYLTQDGQLPRFARLMPNAEETPPELPFCISPSAWVQIVRALTPRTEDYEETVVTLLTSPYVGFRQSVDQRAVREVVARMDAAIEDASPELAIAVLQDSALVQAIVNASEDEVSQQVRDAYSTKARELQEQAARSAAQANAERERRELAEERARARDQDLLAEIQRREAVESDVARGRRALEELETSFEQRIGDLETQSEASLAAERQRRENLELRIRQTLGAVVAVAALLGAAFAFLISPVHGATKVTAFAVGEAIFFLIGLRVVLGARWGGELLVWIFGIIGMLALAVGVIALLPPH
jgi:hypothetical protein